MSFQGLSNSSQTIDVSEVSSSITIGDAEGSFKIFSYDKQRLLTLQTEIEQDHAEKNKNKKKSAPMSNLKRKLVVRDIFQKMVQQKSTSLNSPNT